MTSLIDWFLFKYELLWWYIKDFWEYTPEDLDSCCRR